MIKSLYIALAILFMLLAGYLLSVAYEGCEGNRIMTVDGIECIPFDREMTTGEPFPDGR